MLPKHLDEKVARLHLDALGVKLTTLTAGAGRLHRRAGRRPLQARPLPLLSRALDVARSYCAGVGGPLPGSFGGGGSRWGRVRGARRAWWRRHAGAAIGGGAVGARSARRAALRAGPRPGSRPGRVPGRRRRDAGARSRSASCVLPSGAGASGSRSGPASDLTIVRTASASRRRPARSASAAQPAERGGINDRLPPCCRASARAPRPCRRTCHRAACCCWENDDENASDAEGQPDLDEHSDQPAHQRLPEPDRTAVVAHDPQAQADLAERAPAAQRLERRPGSRR